MTARQLYMEEGRGSRRREFVDLFRSWGQLTELSTRSASGQELSRRTTPLSFAVAAVRITVHPFHNRGNNCDDLTTIDFERTHSA